METKIVDGLLIVKFNMIQTVSLAFVIYYLGAVIRKRVPLFIRFSIPAPVIGGLLFSGLVTLLRLQQVLGVELDGTMQSALMIMFFTTIGMGASALLIKKGGLPLLIFFILSCLLALLQNFVGIALAQLTGIHPLLGIIAGSVTQIGGLGTGGAFGPLFESWGVTGATPAAIACATFGMVSGSLMGGPFGETLIKKYRITTPSMENKNQAEKAAFEQAESAVNGAALMETLAYILVAMGIGSVISFYLTKSGITLPPYIGAMIVAAVIRNVGDITKVYDIDADSINIISDISLAIYLTMAINSLKLWELINLAIPLLIILIGQCIFIILYSWLLVYYIMGRDYEAVQLSVGLVGFGTGATPNALVNMSSLSEKYGYAPKAFVIIPIIGAFLIDFMNALIITWMSGWYH